MTRISLARFGIHEDPEIILERKGCSRTTILHCRAVALRALFIADRIRVRTDRGLLTAGALLHDLGRCRSGGIQHAAVGAAMAERMGFDPAVVRIIRTHLGAGLTPDEARDLGLPPGDYMPRSAEEKIVAHADNLTRGVRPVNFGEAIDAFSRRLESGSAAIARIRCLREEILSWALPEAGDPEEIPSPGTKDARHGSHVDSP